jgi:hypothetical protein
MNNNKGETNTMWIKTLTPLFCAVLIFILELLAVQQGLDGTCLSIAVAAIAGLGGYSIKELIKVVKK